jgi:hypothetical protein
MHTLDDHVAVLLGDPRQTARAGWSVMVNPCADRFTPSGSVVPRDQHTCVLRSGLWPVVVLVLALPSLAQSAQKTPTTPLEQSSPLASPAETTPQASAEPAQPQPAPPRAGTRRPARQSPCWRIAGISPSMVNQRWQIEADAKAKIGAVCSNDSLDPKQKADKLRQIDEQTTREIAKIIPAKQLGEFKTCQAERDREKAQRAGGTPHREIGPCGGAIPAKPSAAEHSHDHQLSSPSKR